MSLLTRLTNKAKSIQWNLKNRLHEVTLQRLDLELLLKTGVRVKVGSYADWGMYTTIFADNEYDAAINAAIDQRPSGAPLLVLDIGANVGFFALRVAHLMALAGGDPKDFRIVCLEGCPETYAQLVRRLAASPAMEGRYEAMHGLAGKLDGSARIASAAFHAMTSIVAPGSVQGTEVPFKNLNTFVSASDSIDLLKCDIEGSEWEVMQNYGDLLRRTRVAVFEFHFDKCSRVECQKYLRDLGFNRARTLEEDRYTSLELFERQ